MVIIDEENFKDQGYAFSRQLTLWKCAGKEIFVLIVKNDGYVAEFNKECGES